MIYEFKGFVPVVDASSCVHPQATVIGNVIIGKDVYIGPGAVLRGDWGGIVVRDGCNVQENCTIHMFPGMSAILDENAHIGHGAIVHGAHIGRNSMIGMNSVIMDDAIIGEECIIGALTFIKAKKVIPKRSLVVGNPGRIVKEVTDEMIDWKTKGTELYQTLPKDLADTLTPCEPLRSIPPDRPDQEQLFETWKEIQNRK